MFMVWGRFLVRILFLVLRVIVGWVFVVGFV